MSGLGSFVNVPSTNVGTSNPANWTMGNVGSVFLAVPVAVNDGEAQGFLIDAFGRQVVMGGEADSGANPLAPIGIGGVYNAALPTYTDGDQVTDQHDINGRKIVSDALLLAAFNAEDFASETTLDALLTAFNAEDFATEVTLDALLTAFNAEDFATEVTLDALLTAFGAEDFATETTLDSLLTAFNAEDFATEVTLDALLTAFNAEDFASETTLDALLTAFNAEDFASETTLATIATQTTPLDVQDQFDTVMLDTFAFNIPASAALPLQVVASLATPVFSLEIVEDIGEFIGIYTGAAAAEVLQAVLPLGGGKVTVRLDTADRVSLRAMENSAISVGKMAINFLG